MPELTTQVDRLPLSSPLNILIGLLLGVVTPLLLGGFGAMFAINRDVHAFTGDPFQKLLLRCAACALWFIQASAYLLVVVAIQVSRKR